MEYLQYYRVQVPNNPALNVGFNDIVIAFWYKGTGNVDWGVIVSHEFEGSFQIFTNQNHIEVVFCENYKYNDILFDGILDETWHHYVISKKDDLIKLYLDCAYYNQFKATCNVKSKGPMCFGTFCAGEFKLLGSLKQMRFYNKVLEEHEVQIIYSYPNCPSFCPDCQILNGNFIKYNSCLGDRQIIGNICKCVNNSRDDYQNELCQLQYPDDGLKVCLYATYDYYDYSYISNLAAPGYNELGSIDYSAYVEDNGPILYYGYSWDYNTNYAYNSGIFNFGEEDFSIGMWIKFEWIGNEAQTIISGKYGGDFNIYLPANSSKLYIRVGQQDVLYLSNLVEDEWRYIIVSKYEKVNMSLTRDDFIVNYCPGCLQLDQDLTLSEMTFGYLGYSKNRFYGYISNFKIWHKRKPQSQHEYYIEKYYFNQQIPSGVTINQCPWQCDTCQQYMGSFKCLTCRGDRQKIGIKCLCPKGTYDDQRSLNCRNVNNIALYYSFDNGLIYDHSVTLFGETDNINNNSNILVVNTNYISFVQDRFGQSNMALDLNEPYFGSNYSKSAFFVNYAGDIFYSEYDDFTISFWINAKPTVTEYTDLQNGYIIHNGDINIYRYDTTNDLRVDIGQQKTNFIIVQDVFDETWNHIVIMRHSEQYLRAYVNGQLSVQDTLIDKIYISPVQELRVGVNYNINEFDGYLDELRYYKKKIDESHIQSLFSYPGCPFQCPGNIGTECQIQNFEIVCLVCWGNRVLINDQCVCPQNFNQDYQTQEICVTHNLEFVNSFFLYLSFDNVLEDSKNNTQIEKFIVISNSIEYGDDKYNVQKNSLNLDRSQPIKIENTLITSFLVNDFTIMFNFKAPVQGEYFGTIFYTSATNGISVYRQGNGQHLAIQIQQSYFIIENILNDQWHHLTILYYDQQYVQVLIDGIIQVQETFIGYQQEWNLNQQIIIGDNEKLDRKFNGFIDELRIYTEKLPMEQIQQIINYQCAFQCQRCDIQFEGLKCQKYEEDIYSLCKGDRRDGIQSEQGICLCPDYTFDDGINEYCQPCPANCKQCNNLQECTQCVDFESQLSVRNVQNLCNCPVQNYFENGNIQCSKCNNDKCILCQDELSCSECVGSNQENKDLRGQSRDCTCPIGFFDNSPEIDCLACNTKIINCIECDKFTGVCTKCQGDLVFKDGVCKCDQNLYTTDLSNPFDTNCSACPENTSCPGGFEISLNQGFWRQNTESDKIQECFNNPDNCIGGSGDMFLQCIEGNIGPLCEDCDIKNLRGHGKFSHASEYTCGSCENVENNVLKIFGILFLQFITLYLSVTGTLSASKDLIRANCLKELFKTGEPQTEEKGVITKILLNYFYLISTILTFRIGIPYSFGSFGNPSKQMSYSMDCFLNEISGDLPLTYFRIIFSVIIAIVQIILVLLLVLILIKLNKVKDNFRSYFYTTIIYQFIATSPGIVTMLFEGMACRQILGKSYIVSNIQDECYTDEYNSYTFSILVPILIIFCIMIPLLFFVSLCKQNTQKKPNQTSPKTLKKNSISKRRSSLFMLNNFEQEKNNQIKDSQNNNLNNTLSLQKYGYLYLEYNNKAYYWEFIKIYQRYLIAVVLTFYYNEIYFKGIMIFFIVTVYSVLQHINQPYKIPSQNKLDQETSVITAISIILGLYMYDNDSIFWFVIAAIVLISINAHIIIQLINKLLMAQAKTKYQKLSQKKQQQEQILARDELKNKIKQLGQEREQIEQQIYNADPQNQDQLNKLIQDKQNNISQIKQYKEMIDQLDIVDNNETKQIVQTKKNQEQKQIDVQKGFYKIMEVAEDIGVKYLGSHSSKAVFNAKKLKQKLKNRIQVFVRGIQYNIFVQNNNFVQNDQKDFKYFTINEFLSGKLTEQDIHQIESEIQVIEKTKFKNSKIILQKLKNYFSDIIMQNPKEFKIYINQQQKNKKITTIKTKLVEQIYNKKQVYPESQDISFNNLGKVLQDNIDKKDQQIQEKSNQFLSNNTNIETQRQLITQNIINETQSQILQKSTSQLQNNLQNKNQLQISQNRTNQDLSISLNNNKQKQDINLSDNQKNNEDIEQGKKDQNENKNQQNNENQSDKENQDLKININDSNEIEIIDLDDSNNKNNSKITESSKLEIIEDQDLQDQDENKIENQINDQNAQESEIKQTEKKYLRKQYAIQKNNINNSTQNQFNILISQDNNMQQVQQKEIENVKNNEIFDSMKNSQNILINTSKYQSAMSLSQTSDKNQDALQMDQLKKSQIVQRKKQYTQYLKNIKIEFNDQKNNQLKTLQGIDDVGIEQLQQEIENVKDFNNIEQQQYEDNQDLISLDSQNEQKIEAQVEKYIKDFDIQDFIEIYQRFQVLDESKDGNIEVQEFLEIVNILGLSVSKQDIQFLLQLVSKNPKQINFLEFATILIFQRKEKTPIKELRLIFQYFMEIPGNIYLDINEIQLMINNILNVHISKKQISALINQESSIKSNNLISFQDFINLVN